MNSDNLLRKIIEVRGVKFTFEFLKEEFVSHSNSKMAIDIVVERLDAEINGPNMWHFIYVIKSILFDRGEKAAEIVLIEVKFMLIKSNIVKKDRRVEYDEIRYNKEYNRLKIEEVFLNRKF